MSKRCPLRLNKTEWLYVLLCFALSLACALVFLDYNSTYGPDEWGRIKVPGYIAQNGVIPNGYEPELIMEGYGFSYALQMKLPYLLGGVFMRIAQVFGAGERGMAIAARLVSVLSEAGVAFVSIRLTKKVTDSPCRWVFIALMTLIPQRIFIGSYFNLDAYTMLAVLLIVDSWAEGIQSRWDFKSCVYVGLSMGLCVLGYEYAYGFLIASVLLYFGWFLLHRREESFRRFFLYGCLISAVFLLVCGWYFVRNALLFDGDIFAYREQFLQSDRFAGEDWRIYRQMTMQKQGISLIDMVLSYEFLWSNATSSFCMLGSMELWIPYPYYKTYYLFLLLGCIAFLALRPQRAMDDDRRGTLRLFMGALLLGALIDVGLSVYASWARDYQPQGRYILYTFIPVCMAAAVGWHRAVQRLAKRWKIDPRILQWGVTGALFAFLAVADAVALLRLLERFVWIQ